MGFGIVPVIFSKVFDKMMEHPFISLAVCIWLLWLLSDQGINFPQIGK